MCQWHQHLGLRKSPEDKTVEGISLHAERTQLREQRRGILRSLLTIWDRMLVTQSFSRDHA